MRRWKKYALIFTALCVFAALGYWLWDRIAFTTSSSRLQAFKAELDKTDPGWRLEEIVDHWNAHLPQGDENPFAICEKVMQLTPQKIFNDDLKNLSNANKSQRTLGKLEINRLPAESQLQHSRRIVNECSNAIEMARRLRFCENLGGAKIEMPEHPGKFFASTGMITHCVYNLLYIDVLLSASSGDGNRAIEDLQAHIHLIKTIDGEPSQTDAILRASIIRTVVCNLERTLALTEPTQGLRELQADITTEIHSRSHTRILRAKRAQNNLFFECLENGKLNLTTTVLALGPRGVTRTPILDNFYYWQYKSSLPVEHLFYLKIMTQIIDITKGEIHEQKDLLSRLSMQKSYFRISNQFLSSVRLDFETEIELQTKLRCAVVAIGCERFRQKNHRWPTDLGELGTEFLPEGIPIDPYSGQTLLYKRYAGGAVVYCRGEDKEDNQGNVSTGGKPGSDEGFRLWDPDRRGMEPLPE